MKTITIAALTIGALAVVAAAGGAAVMYSGAYSVAADEPHTRPVYALLDLVRERSIATRANELQVPADIVNPVRVRQGAGNYAAMCAGCHLSPGAEETELSKGLYPAPPDLSQHAVAPAKAFWAIKHGIKASGMPAWGKSMGDDYIWNMAAFLQALPKLDQAEYEALVASSGGHEHGGGETGGHAGGHSDESSEADRHVDAEQAPTANDSSMPMEGKQHAHTVAPDKNATESEPQSEPADHDSHQH